MSPEPKPHKRHTDIADVYDCRICTPPRPQYGIRGKSRAVPPVTTTVYFLSGRSPDNLNPHTALSLYASGRNRENAEVWDRTTEWVLSHPCVVLGPTTPEMGVLEYDILGSWRGRSIDNDLRVRVAEWAASSNLESLIQNLLSEMMQTYPNHTMVAITSR